VKEEKRGKESTKSLSLRSKMPLIPSSYENRELIQFGPFLKLQILDTGIYFDSGTGPQAYYVCFYLTLMAASINLKLSDKRPKDDNNMKTGNRCFAEYMSPLMTEWKTLAYEVLQLAALTTEDREAVLTVVMWHDTVPSRTLLYHTVTYATLSPLLVHPRGLALQLDDATNNHALLH
jgi:hypothetical protein